MPVNFQGLRIFILQKTKIGIFLERTGEINEIAISLRHQSSVRQPGADRLRNIKRRRALGHILHASIRKLHMNAVCHKVETCSSTESFSLLEGLGRVKP